MHSLEVVFAGSSKTKKKTQKRKTNTGAKKQYKSIFFRFLGYANLHVCLNITNKKKTMKLILIILILAEKNAKKQKYQQKKTLNRQNTSSEQQKKNEQSFFV